MRQYAAFLPKKVDGSIVTKLEGRGAQI